MKRANRGKSARRVQRGDYGPVLIVAGKFKGRVGYYDDDDGLYAFVHMGKPFESHLARARLTSLRKIPVTPLDLARWTREHPDLAEILDIRSKRT